MEKPSRHEDILALISEYLSRHNYPLSLLTLASEHSQQASTQKSLKSQAARVRKALLDGDWVEVERLLSKPIFRSQPNYCYHIWRQLFLEYVEAGESMKAMGILTRKLKPLESCDDLDFRQLSYLLTSRYVSAPLREDCLEACEKLLSTGEAQALSSAAFPGGAPHPGLSLGPPSAASHAASATGSAPSVISAGSVPTFPVSAGGGPNLAAAPQAFDGASASSAGRLEKLLDDALRFQGVPESRIRSVSLLHDYMPPIAPESMKIYAAFLLPVSPRSFASSVKAVCVWSTTSLPGAATTPLDEAASCAPVSSSDGTNTIVSPTAPPIVHGGHAFHRHGSAAAGVSSGDDNEHRIQGSRRAGYDLQHQSCLPDRRHQPLPLSTCTAATASSHSCGILASAQFSSVYDKVWDMDLMHCARYSQSSRASQSSSSSSSGSSQQQQQQPLLACGLSTGSISLYRLETAAVARTSTLWPTGASLVAVTDRSLETDEHMAQAELDGATSSDRSRPAPSGSYPPPLFVCEPAACRLVHVLDQHHERDVYSVSFHPELPLLCSGGFDRMLRITDLVRMSTVLSATASASDGSPSVQATVTDPQQIMSLPPPSQVRITPPGTSLSLASAAVAGQPSFLSSGTLPLSTVVAKPSVGSIRPRSWAYHQAAITSVMAGSNLIVTGARDATIKLWDRISASCVRTLQYHLGEVTCVRLSHDGKMVLSNGKDHTVRLYDLRANRLFRTYRGHLNCSKNHLRCAFLGESHIMSASEDGAVVVWDMLSGDVVARLETGFGDAVFDVVYDPHFNQIVAGCDFGRVVVFR